MIGETNARNCARVAKNGNVEETVGAGRGQAYLTIIIFSNLSPSGIDDAPIVAQRELDLFSSSYQNPKIPTTLSSNFNQKKKKKKERKELLILERND